MPDFITNITAKDNASSTINKVKDGFKSIGDSTKDLERIKSAFDKITTSTKPVKKQEIDPCLNEETSKEGRAAAHTGDAIRVDVETHKSVIQSVGRAGTEEDCDERNDNKEK